MQTALAFIIIFGSLVFFHELGHFIFAKRAGILVREFAIGMGPKIIGITKGETIYTLRLLPIGGYVRMAGEDLDQIELQPGYRVGLILNEDNVVEKIILNQKAQYSNILFMEVEKADLLHDLWIEGYDEEDQFKRFSIARDAIIVENGQETLLAPYDRQFGAQTLGHRFMTIFAGPLFNFILAFVIFAILAVAQGIPTYEPVVYDVNEDSPAQNAGLLPGDLVKEINGEKISEWYELTAAVQKEPEAPLHMIVERDGKEINLEVMPELKEVDGQKMWMIGITYKSPVEHTWNPITIVSYGAQQTYEGTTLIVTLLGKLIGGEFSIDALSGPVGIYQATDEVVKFGVFSLMYWGAMLSINLGIMNLLPLPALDGGRLLFFIFEAVRGKPIDRQKEGFVHFVGIVLLMILMVIVTWNDIQRLFF